VWISSYEETPLELRASRLDIAEDEALHSSPSGPVADSDRRVRSTYAADERCDPHENTSADIDRDPVPGDPPRIMGRSIARFGTVCTEQATLLRGDGSVYVEYSPMSELHYLPARRLPHRPRRGHGVRSLCPCPSNSPAIPQYPPVSDLPSNVGYNQTTGQLFLSQRRAHSE
jgi:hypothetical protein